MDMEEAVIDFNKILYTDRLRKSSIIRTAPIDEFYSDRSRIIYSSSFRRLLQKAQVFSLEPNASVRTRLTHSLEVSDLGRTLANRIAVGLCENGYLDPDKMQEMVAVVENAWLLHDIGNPPFGHFGESAIRDWAKSFTSKDIIPADIRQEQGFARLMNDFCAFDGNPQGFRTVTRLHTDFDEHSLNLTYATLLSTIKYPKIAGDYLGTYKKSGVFQSEKDLIDIIWNNVDMKKGHRYPLVYIMEAADDIAYCMSDIADGIEKGILSTQDFVEVFKKEWERGYCLETIPVELPRGDDLVFGRDISVPWSRLAMDEAVQNFFMNMKEIYNGTADALINPSMPMGKVLETIKRVSRKILYSSFEAESIELTGYAVITGILKHYEKLIKLDHGQISALLNGTKADGIEFERRLFNRLGDRYKKAYRYAIERLDSNCKEYSVLEMWFRIHLVIDHIAGMTDEYALETYQMLEGIELMHK